MNKSNCFWCSLAALCCCCLLDACFWRRKDHWKMDLFPIIFHLRVVNACHMYVRLPFKNTIWLVSWNATLFIYFYFLLCFSFAKFVGWFWHLSIHIVSLCFMLFSLSFHKSNLFLQIKSINPTTTLTCLNRFKSNEFQVGSIVKVKHYQ